MKKAICFLFFSLTAAFLPFAASAQDNVLKVNTLSPAVRTASLFYEYVVGRNSTLQFGLLYTGMKYNETTARGYAFTPEFRYYFSKKKSVPKGIYMGAYYRYQNLGFSKDRFVTYTFPGKGSTTVTETAEAELITSGGGILVGNQIILKNKFTIDGFIGPGYNNGNVEHKDNAASVDFDTNLWEGFTVRFGLAVGLAF